MLIVKSINETVEGTWFEKTVWGAKIKLKIRPRNDSVVKRLKEKYRYIRGETERDEAIMKAFKDYVLEDFEGVGDAIDKPWEVTPENKDRVLSIDLPFGEKPLYAWVLDRANELSVEVVEDDLKNS